MMILTFPKETKKGSFYDTRGKLCVDCSECERGGNGDKSCSSGWKKKTKHKGSCFSGTIIGDYENK